MFEILPEERDISRWIFQPSTSQLKRVTDCCQCPIKVPVPISFYPRMVLPSPLLDMILEHCPTEPSVRIEMSCIYPAHESHAAFEHLKFGEIGALLLTLRCIVFTFRFHSTCGRRLLYWTAQFPTSSKRLHWKQEKQPFVVKEMPMKPVTLNPLI